LAVKLDCLQHVCQILESGNERALVLLRRLVPTRLGGALSLLEEDLQERA
jgi:hypothetical protein